MTPDSTALLAIEQRVRAQIAAQLSNISTRFGAYLGSVVKASPNTSATEILSRHDVHEVLTTTLGNAQAEVEQSTNAGYKAAAALAIIALAAEFGPVGHDVPSSTLPTTSDYLSAIITGVRTAFQRALLDIHNTVRAAHDGVTGDPTAAARVLITNAAFKRAVRRLGVRVTAAGVVAVHRGFTEAQLSAYQDYKKVNPYIVISKRWETTAEDPCPTCRALDGTVIALDAEFDRGDTLAVFRDLLGPPRHPNCRCRLVLDFDSDRIEKT